VDLLTTSRLALEGGRPLRARFLPFHQPFLGPEEEAEVLDTLRSGWLTTGPKSKAFERALADYVGARHAVAMNSCTAALHVALEAHGVGSGDEVITTPITFASTANVIVHCRATPVFVDVTPDTFTIDPVRIDSAITPRTRAIIPVHLAGLVCDMDAINSIARERRLTVVEDAAHAIGATYADGVRVGASGNPTCFSFYATKNVTSGEGGALTTNDADLAERAAVMSLHGISHDAWKRYSAEGYKHWEVVYPGYKYNMPDLQAALVLPQLQKIDRFADRRRELKRRLDVGLAQVPELTVPADPPGRGHAHHLYPVLVQTERLTADRDLVMNAIQAENVGVGVHFRAVHLQRYYAERWGFHRGMLPHAEYYSDRTLSLPFYPKMTDQDADDVIAVVHKVVARYRK
jgi:dTDP-4-amino-4,6-dideoxygalactose transaminase